MNAIKDAGLRKEDIDGFIPYGTSHPQGRRLHHTQTSSQKSLGIRPNFPEPGVLRYRTFPNKAIGPRGRGLQLRPRRLLPRAAAPDTGPGRMRSTPSATSPMTNTPPTASIPSRTTPSLPPAARCKEFGTGRTSGARSPWHRRWANLNPIANYYSKPLTKEDYMAAPCLPGPFRGVDATTSTDGGRAVIITTAERAKELRNLPVTIRGFGVFNDTSKGWQLTPGDPRSSALIAGKLAYEMAGLAQDIGAAQIYDCYTYTVEATLADYGFYDQKEVPRLPLIREHRPRRGFP